MCVVPASRTLLEGVWGAEEEEERRRQERRRRGEERRRQERRRGEERRGEERGGKGGTKLEPVEQRRFRVKTMS